MNNPYHSDYYEKTADKIMRVLNHPDNVELKAQVKASKGVKYIDMQDMIAQVRHATNAKTWKELQVTGDWERAFDVPLSIVIRRLNQTGEQSE